MIVQAAQLAATNPVVVKDVVAAIDFAFTCNANIRVSFLNEFRFIEKLEKESIFEFLFGTHEVAFEYLEDFRQCQ